MRDEAHLAAMETALQAALMAKRDPTLTPLELQPVATGCMVALLDDEPHARLDKKRSTVIKPKSGAEDDATAEVDSTAPPGTAGGERTHGLSPAVATRLQAVLRLSLKSLTLSRQSMAARRASQRMRMTSTTVTLRHLLGGGTSPLASTVAEEEEPQHEAQEHDAHHSEGEFAEISSPASTTRVEMLAAVSTQVDHQPDSPRTSQYADPHLDQEAASPRISQ
jgi:hypothetical protein